MNRYVLISKLSAYRRWADTVEEIHKYMADEQFHLANNEWDVTKNKRNKKQQQQQRTRENKEANKQQQQQQNTKIWTVTRKQTKKIVVEKTLNNVR